MRLCFYRQLSPRCVALLLIVSATMGKKTLLKEAIEDNHELLHREHLPASSFAEGQNGQIEPQT